MWSALLVLTVRILCSTVIQSKYLDEDMLLFWKRSGSVDCKPFTTYTVECNRCVCGADAIEYCTRMTCLKKTGRFEDSDYSGRD